MPFCSGESTRETSPPGSVEIRTFRFTAIIRETAWCIFNLVYFQVRKAESEAISKAISRTNKKKRKVRGNYPINQKYLYGKFCTLQKITLCESSTTLFIAELLNIIKYICDAFLYMINKNFAQLIR